MDEHGTAKPPAKRRTDPRARRRLGRVTLPVMWARGGDGPGTVGVVDDRAAATIPSDGCAWLERVHPGDVESVRRALGAAIDEHGDFRCQARVLTAGDQYRWTEIRLLPMFRLDRTIECWVGEWTDIHSMREAEAERGRAELQTVQMTGFLDTLQQTAPIGFLFVDRDFRYVCVNQKLADLNGRAPADHIGRTVAEVVPSVWEQAEPIYRKVLDLGEPILDIEMSGDTAAAPGEARHWLTNFYPVWNEGEVLGVGVVVVDITERVESERAICALTEAAIEAVAAAVEAKDPYTAGHQRRVGDLAAAIATELGMSEEVVEGIRVAARVHDIGKVSVPAEILSKPAGLTPNEFALVKEHPQTGYDIVRGIEFPWPVADMILQHHERLDGSGYPNGLAGDEILVGARVIAVADTVEAMASYRPYRASLGIDVALAQIERDRAVLLDADVVDACLRLFREGRFSLEVGR